jgi:hypothetical protein
MRLYPAIPGNPRLRIEGESPQSGKDIRSSLHPGYVFLQYVKIGQWPLSAFFIEANCSGLAVP